MMLRVRMSFPQFTATEHMLWCLHGTGRDADDRQGYGDGS